MTFPRSFQTIYLKSYRYGNGYFGPNGYLVVNKSTPTKPLIFLDLIYLYSELELVPLTFLKVIILIFGILFFIALRLKW